MKLYHVSTLNKNKVEINMTESVKNDVIYVYFLMDNMNAYTNFYQAYSSQLIEMYSNQKGWSKEKLAVEAIFEYVRLLEYSNSPSRLLYAYFTDSIDNAKTFNQVERNNCGDYFSFEAEEDKVFYYDMDIFDSAVKTLESVGLTEIAFENLKMLARKYWLTSRDGNTEILYQGRPILKNISNTLQTSP
ncbi:MAG: hypothetical protein IJ447_05730 [Clostridia bacterium]|nr:hypothetical protein [Clostridia bacterium]